jgi:hypothetical protein
MLYELLKQISGKNSAGPGVLLIGYSRNDLSLLDF